MFRIVRVGRVQIFLEILEPNDSYNLNPIYYCIPNPISHNFVPLYINSSSYVFASVCMYSNDDQLIYSRKYNDKFLHDITLELYYC